MKKLCKWLLLIALVTALCCGIATADTVASGTCGDSLTWTLDSDGLLTIGGSGSMNNFEQEQTPWSEFGDSIQSVVIESGVTSIGDYAFSSLFNLTRITISDSVTSIRTEAFYYSPAISEILVSPANTSFKSVDGILYTYDGTILLFCPRTKTNVTVLEGTEVIAEGAFLECNNLTAIQLPDSLKEIGSIAFWCCDKLTSVSIPEGVTTIRHSAFAECGFTSIVIPDSVTTLENGIFWACYSLESAMLPAGITSIPVQLFCDCQKLANITIPNGVTSIGRRAFENCIDLPSITIPAGVTRVNERAFSGCNSLTDVYFVGSLAQWDSVSIGPSNGALIANVHCTDGISTSHAYSGSLGDGITYSLLNGELTVSGAGSWNVYPFDSSADISRAVFLNGVTEIPEHAFDSCSNLQFVSLPSTISTIGEYAFAGCTALTDVNYSGSQAQWNAVTIGAGNSKLIAHVQCIDGVSTSHAYSGTRDNGITYSVINGVLTVSGAGSWDYSSPFNSCIEITHAVFLNGVTEIPDLSSCTNLQTISFPTTISKIDSYTFYNCPALTDVYYSGSEEQWNEIAISQDGNENFLAATIHYNSSGPLFPAPVVSVQHGTLRQDMTITVTSTEDAEVEVELSPDGYDDEFYSNILPGGTNTITIHGWELTDFDSFTLTAASLLRETNESGEEEWSYGERTETRIVLEAPDQELAELPAMTFSAPEGKSGELTMTVEGAEAIAYLAIYEGLGGGYPNEYHDGSTVTLEAEGGDFGRYEIYCWARFSGLWYWVNSGEVTILPSGELAVPAVSLNGQTLTRNTLQTVALADPMTLAASCAKADSISYQVAKVNGSFDMSLVHFTEDGSYMELTSSAGMDGWDDNEYDETESFWMGSSGSTSSINILDQLTLVPGDYRVMITAYSDDSGIKKGQFVAWLRIPPTSGTCGENVNWALNDSTLTISGTGDMFDYDWNTGAPWKDASAEIRTIVVGNGVTGIGDYAFRSCTALTSVTLPEGLTRIGDAAFMRCSAMADITLPSTLKIIGPSAFESTGIQEITLYDGLTSIGEYAFMDSALRKINIPAGTATKSEVFFVHNWQKDKDELIRITVPESVTDLDVSDFFGTFLPAVEPGFVTPAALTTIESEAFSGIAASYIWLTDNVQSIGANAFSGCSGLQYIRIPNNCTSFGANAFPAGTILLVDYNADAYDALEAAGYTNIMKLVEGFNG